MNQTVQFTYSGEKQAEKMVSKLLKIICSQLTSAIFSSDIKALVLLGGYGKGEGGIIFRDGEYQPHNNFDLLLVTKNTTTGSWKSINTKITDRTKKLEEELGIEIDISVISENKLRYMPTRVFWYDMKVGHRTLYGDSQLIPSITHDLVDIPDWDMRNLMVNRGSLMMINQLCIEQLNKNPYFNLPLRKLIIKHTMKAVIGYGDALLYFKGLYHWSYVEKLNRFIRIVDINNEFRSAYQDAVNFRFSPSYKNYLDLDLKQWQSDISALLSEIHLKCEAIRLNTSSLNWYEYLEISLEKLLIEEKYSFKTFAKLLLGLLTIHHGKLPHGISMKARLGYYASSHQQILPVLFPLLNFALEKSGNTNELALFLSSHFKLKEKNQFILLGSYLSRWSSVFATNLSAILSRYSITL